MSERERDTCLCETHTEKEILEFDFNIQSTAWGHIRRERGRERKKKKQKKGKQTDGLTETDRLYHTERQKQQGGGEEGKVKQQQRNRRTDRLVTVSNTLSSRGSFQTHTQKRCGRGGGGGGRGGGVAPTKKDNVHIETGSRIALCS